MIKYAIMFSFEGVFYCLTKYEWRLGRLRDGAWAAPKYKFAEWLTAEGSRIMLFNTKEEALQITHDLFCWDDGYDCGTFPYFTYKDEHGSIKVYPRMVRVCKLTYEPPHLEYV